MRGTKSQHLASKKEFSLVFVNAAKKAPLSPDHHPLPLFPFTIRGKGLLALTLRAPQTDACHCVYLHYSL